MKTGENYNQGVTRRLVTFLRPGDKCDLENDPIADNFDEREGEPSRFEFEFERVLSVTIESADCVRVDFESGFSCGFPINHEIEVDGEQTRTRERKPLAWNGRRRA